MHYLLHYILYITLYITYYTMLQSIHYILHIQAFLLHYILYLSLHYTLHFTLLYFYILHIHACFGTLPDTKIVKTWNFQHCSQLVQENQQKHFTNSVRSFNSTFLFNATHPEEAKLVKRPRHKTCGKKNTWRRTVGVRLGLPTAIYTVID